MDHSRFGSLSPELRNRIYELVFGEPATLRFTARFGTTTGVELAITKTCRQARDESLSMCYANTHMRLQAMNDSAIDRLIVAMNAMGAVACASLEGISIVVNRAFIGVHSFKVMAAKCAAECSRVKLTKQVDKLPLLYEHLNAMTQVHETLLKLGLHTRTVLLGRELPYMVIMQKVNGRLVELEGLLK